MPQTTTSSRSADGQTDGQRPSRAVMFDLLGNSRRRRALRYLLDEPTMTLTKLSARIAAWENGVPTDDLSSRQRKQVYSSLYQTHVPRLSEHGLVEYDADDRTVRLTGDRDRIRRFLELDDAPRRTFSHRWSRYFFWTAVVGSAAIAGNWLGTAPATHLGTEDLYGLLTVTFMMLSVSFAMAVEGPKLVQVFD
ncbi:DUF7344 domain-containing protein [Halorussus halobius]|uniref:DUF7344 domain-containing protein n=1 Tax=Halorussus halobius TaxID=1710537 RepID=UPI001092F146|nr:ArsR family transcriptional regulator [Halorussus halobius]